MTKTIYLRHAQNYKLDYLKQAQQLFHVEIAVVLNMSINMVIITKCREYRLSGQTKIQL
ncbi:hypothetical protein [Thomasclavelia cocleata]|uniref:hypothetical protein n=1 Tax=Thomasclavelia cocleata TaxID=69824 RepID=UPI0015D6283F|nr:hypothetical protein [Thomasclavelia cocleata]MCR1960703.1 hypothetical protein [Thomasclavelia cocleata]